MASKANGADSGRPVLQASFIGQTANSRLRSRPTAVVHSAYVGALNILTKSGLIGIVPKRVGRGPINVTLEDDDVDLGVLASPGDPVILSEDLISVAGMPIVSIGGAKICPPGGRFTRPLLPASTIVRNSAAARKVVVGEGDLRGLGGLLVQLGEDSPAVRPAQNWYCNAALPAVVALLGAIRKGDHHRIRLATKRLAGLGPGLTPSGDDVLSGLMLAIALGKKNGLDGIWSSPAIPIVEGADGRTSTLSLEFMKEASSGRANEVAVRFVEDIYTASEPEVTASALCLLKTGATSGTDMAAGIVLGARAALGLEALSEW
jgi:uncharacterized protein DUF2877